MRYWWGAMCICFSIGFYLMYSNYYFSCKPAVLVFPGANSRETYFTIHKIKEAQNLSQGKGCKVGILDHSFGIAFHPELYAGGKNFVVDSNEYLTKKEWHGYWMAVTLHEIAPQADIYAFNVHSFKSPKSTVRAIEKAIDWAIENNFCVLTYSHAAIKNDDFNKALDKAHKAGIVTTFIHTKHPGNILPSGLGFKPDDGREPDVNVLEYDYTVVKGKEWKNECEKEKSARKDLYAQFLSVSSMSPVVGGVVALMKSLNPDLSPAECKIILKKTSHASSYMGKKSQRALDALAAVKYVKKIKNRSNVSKLK